ncbi:MAG: hypothetical protein ROZ00_16215 [Denitratisoma sp.]|nr:hypothetical protein [Denitratisoma sp.]
MVVEHREDVVLAGQVELFGEDEDGARLAYPVEQRRLVVAYPAFRPQRLDPAPAVDRIGPGADLEGGAAEQFTAVAAELLDEGVVGLHIRPVGQPGDADR